MDRDAPSAVDEATAATAAILDIERPAWLERALPGATGRGVRIGVVDSGFDPAWSDPMLRPGVGLAAQGLAPPFPEAVLRPSADWADRIGHGTACASILRAMAPGAELHPIRVFGLRLATTVEILAAALAWAAGQGLHLVNLSLGTTAEGSIVPLYRACAEARRRGVAIVAAVDPAGRSSYPAVFEEAIGVGAGRFANVWDYEYRPGEAVECTAQGERRVRVLGGRETDAWGTSFAAPHLTAVAALLLERHPGVGLDDLRGLLARHALTARRALRGPAHEEPSP